MIEVQKKYKSGEALTTKWNIYTHIPTPTSLLFIHLLITDICVNINKMTRQKRIK